MCEFVGLWFNQQLHYVNSNPFHVTHVFELYRRDGSNGGYYIDLHEYVRKRGILSLA